MKIGIDASNIKSDGGVIHLFELLNNINYQNHNIDKIVLWANKDILNKIKDSKKIHKIKIDHINKNILLRFLWQFISLPNNLIRYNCNIFFVLGGVFFRKKIKTVSIFQNILPFIDDDIKRYSFLNQIKLLLQKKIYLNSFNNSDGIIFLSDFSKKILKKNLNLKNKIIKKIPHGVSKIFKFKKRRFNKQKIKLLYVSKLDIYKNQKKIILAFFYLKKFLNLQLSLIGSYEKNNKKILENEISQLNLNKYIKIFGKIDYKKLPKIYNQHDIKIYASKSETFGMTMLEALKCGLPVLSIKNEISKEILKDAGFYCKNNSHAIKDKLVEIIKNKKNLDKKILLGKKISDRHQWKTTAKNTFEFLEKVSKIK